MDSSSPIQDEINGGNVGVDEKIMAVSTVGEMDKKISQFVTKMNVCLTQTMENSKEMATEMTAQTMDSVAQYEKKILDLKNVVCNILEMKMNEYNAIKSKIEETEKEIRECNEILGAAHGEANTMISKYFGSFTSIDQSNGSDDAELGSNNDDDYGM